MHTSAARGRGLGGQLIDNVSNALFALAETDDIEKAGNY